VLRSAGADIRLARRAVRAALAGWYANTQGAQPVDLSAELANAIRAQLAPLVERLDRLEARL
jgi:ATP-dependent Clp protease ATP-binding subunit ClpC